MSTALADITKQVQAELANLKGAVEPPSGFMVNLKGKQFTLPDGTQHPGPMRCVILDFRTENRYYPGMYNANNPQPPACFAVGKELETLGPSEGVPKPQSETCKECQFNQWGSDPNGGKGKACKNTRKIAVVAADATNDTKPMVITVSPSGIAGFDGFVRNLEKVGMLPTQVIAEISFDSKEDYPKLVFGDSPEPHDKLELFWVLREKAQELLDKVPEVKTQ